MSLISIFITSILTENIILTKFLGMCPFFGISRSEKGALGMGLAVILVTFLSSLTTYFLYYQVLVPSDTEYLKTLVFILVMAGFVQLLDIILKRFAKKIHKLLGAYLPLIATNCAIFGVVLLNIASEYTLSQTITYSLGSSIGYLLVIYVFSGIRERLEYAPIPRSFRGLPIAFIIAFIMALIFSRYMGA